MIAAPALEYDAWPFDSRRRATPDRTDPCFTLSAWIEIWYQYQVHSGNSWKLGYAPRGTLGTFLMCLSRITRWGTWGSSDVHIWLTSLAQASARNKLGSPWSRESCPASRATVFHSTHFFELCYPWSHATHSSFSWTPSLIAYAMPIFLPGISGFNRASPNLYPGFVVWAEVVISEVVVWICGSVDSVGQAGPGDLSYQMALSNPSYAKLLT